MGRLVYPARLKRAILARRKRPTQQFGQPADDRVWGGKTACTHTVLQWLAWYVTGRWYTLNQVNTMAGAPTNATALVRDGLRWRRVPRGLREGEVKSFLKAAKLPYRVVRDYTPLQVAHASKLGPVGFGHMYGWWPEWRGYRYGGVRADGRPNGYATPSGKAGRTQLAGFTGRHFGLLLGYATDAAGPDLYYAWEPNHGSSARPERPPYDRMTFGQFVKAYDSFRVVGKQKPYAVIPTEAIH